MVARRSVWQGAPTLEPDEDPTGLASLVEDFRSRLGIILRLEDTTQIVPGMAGLPSGAQAVARGEVQRWTIDRTVDLRPRKHRNVRVQDRTIEPSWPEDVPDPTLKDFVLSSGELAAEDRTVKLDRRVAAPRPNASIQLAAPGKLLLYFEDHYESLTVRRSEPGPDLDFVPLQSIEAPVCTVEPDGWQATRLLVVLAAALVTLAAAALVVST